MHAFVVFLILLINQLRTPHTRFYKKMLFILHEYKTKYRVRTNIHIISYMYKKNIWPQLSITNLFPVFCCCRCYCFVLLCFSFYKPIYIDQAYTKNRFRTKRFVLIIW